MTRNEAALGLALALHNYDPTGIESLQEDAALIEAMMIKREKPLIEMLKRLEWDRLERTCAVCGTYEFLEPHKLDCEYDALLKGYES